MNEPTPEVIVLDAAMCPAHEMYHDNAPASALEIEAFKARRAHTDIDPSDMGCPRLARIRAAVEAEKANPPA
jgi:hypothetical protein